VIRRSIALACAALAFGAAACSSQPPAPSGGPNGARATLVGAGSTFDYPLFSRAFYQYSQLHPGVTVNYQSIGSGGGIQQFTAKTVDFGATDVPMGSKELAAVAGGAAAIVQIPVTLGGVVVSYNVPDAPANLRLDPAVLSNIFLGKIANWNDPAISGLNPGAHLKSLPIAVVHRADGSGTTYIFTSYLSAVSPQWKTVVGVGKTVAWPAASSVGAKGNEGVAGQIRNTPGAIGYIELSYATQNSMPAAALQNASGAFVIASENSVKAAAAAKPSVSAKDFAIVNEPGASAYPIAGYSWVLLYRHYPDAGKQAALYDLFRWLLRDGQQYAASVSYVPLPPNVAAAAQQQLR